MTIWWPEIPVWEIVVRAVGVYISLLVMIRMSGKRDVGEMSHADLLLILLLGASVHTSMSGDDKSVLGGIIGAVALMLTNFSLNHFSFKFRKFEKFVKGVPEVIINKGQPVQSVMQRHRMTEMQLKMAIRKEHAENFEEVRLAILEVDGEISVFKNL